jgi:hypothetical protein
MICSMSSPRIWNWDPTVDKIYQPPIANLLSLSAILQEYPEEPGHGGNYYPSDNYRFLIENRLSIFTKASQPR